MENPQMGMPAEMAPQGPNPEEMAIYEQMRQQISPQEFSNEMLAGASQVDPQAVAEFTEELRGLDVSPEELDALNDLVDQILANPEQYDQLRQQFLAQGMPDDILPEQFDPYFFAALNMAVDQMIAAPTGVQAFAQGGIAELKPIAKAIASYGRNGDTMLAHITPAEARMLKRRGGSGTINPATGLPEFFLKKAFKSIGKAVKKFASSTVGRLVTTVALGFFLGPAAASFLGASSVAGVAAVSGFVGSAGSTLLAGGNLKDALRAGAVGGITAGAGAGLMGGADAFASGSASTAGLTPGQAFQGQIDKFTGAFTPGASVQAPVPEAGAPTAGLGSNQMPVPDAAPYSELKMTGAPVKPFPEFFGDQASAAAGAPAPAGSAFDATASQGSLAKPLGGTQPGMFDSAKKFVSENISPSGIKEAATPAAQEAGSKAVSDLLARVPTATPAMQEAAYQTAFKSVMPGVLGTYGPAVGAGLGIMGLAGGFESKPVQGGPITQSLMKPVTQRIREGGTQRQMYMQGLPGVVYDEFGAPVFGQSTRLPTYDVPDYDYGGFNMSGAATGGQGGMSLPPVYNTPSGSIGSRQVAQPYNTSSMYTNLMGPQRYAGGGDVQHYAEGGVAETTDIFKRVLGRDPTSAEFAKWQDTFKDGMDVKKWTAFTEDPTIAEEQKAYNVRTSESRAATLAKQEAARNKVAQEKAMRRAAGSGNMYGNINAGISALAPETNPMDSADTGFGARNRTAAVAQRQAAYAPMLQGQRFAMDQQAGIAASGQLPRNVSGYSGQDKAELYRGLARQGLTDAQIRAAAENRYGMQTDADWRGLQNIVTPPVAQPPGGPITTMPIAPPVTQPPVNVVGPITPSPIAPPGDTETIRINPPPPDFSDDPGARVGPGMSMVRDMEYRPGRDYDPVTFKPMTPPGEMRDMEYRPGRDYDPVTFKPMTPPPGSTGGMYSNITNPGAGYTGPNLYSQTLAAGLLPTGEDKMAAYQRLTQQGATDPQIRNAAETMFGPQSNANWNALSGGAARFMNMGGIAALAQGGYPRRNGQISGPGTEKSDSIPAMLSDGEFVMTAKAVRGAGKGNRRAGAKQMYKLMHQLEKNSERG
jgi:hypothetical protein